MIEAETFKDMHSADILSFKSTSMKKLSTVQRLKVEWAGEPGDVKSSELYKVSILTDVNEMPTGSGFGELALDEDNS